MSVITTQKTLKDVNDLDSIIRMIQLLTRRDHYHAERMVTLLPLKHGTENENQLIQWNDIVAQGKSYPAAKSQLKKLVFIINHYPIE